MRKLYLSVTLTFITIFSFGQRNCPSTVDMTLMQTQDPVRYQRFMDLEKFTSNYTSQGGDNYRLADPNGLIVIPVVVHVLHRNEAIGTGRNISLAQIQSQIDVLNQDFRRLNADRTNTPAAFAGVASDYNFEFRLACQDPYGNPTNGVLRRYTNKVNFQYIAIPNTNGSPNETAMGIKMTNISGESPWPTDRYLNIWVCDFSDGTLGYSTFPADFANNPNVDGVVISTTAMGNTGNVSAPFNKGRTATHEIGHWLNLRHTWGDANCGSDLVADTPQQQAPNFGCPSFPHRTCGNTTNGDMFMNYMDYTDDACMNAFTKGQSTRGRAIFANGGSRAAFIDNYFRIQQPSAITNCVRNLKLTNPNCLPVTWSIVSGPAIINGQGTNYATVQATGSGTVVVRASAANYMSEISISTNTSLANPSISATQTSLPGDPTTVNFKTEQFFGITYNWYVNNVLKQSGTSNEFEWYFPCNITKTIKCTLTNAVCGTSNYSNSITITGECKNRTLYSVSPNPSSNNITVSVDEYTETSIEGQAKATSIDEIRITDFQGNLRIKKSYSSIKRAKLDISELANGLYVIEISSKDNTEKQRLLVDK